jgi:NADPH:quinone reductase-like Zn-dependent oxidoreductase
MSTTITFSRYGEPDVLTVSAAEAPRPGPGQVRIRVRAVAVNPIDAKIRSGHMDGIFPISLPMTPGWDVAGVVDAAGPGADAAPGDEVFGVASVGGYSEYALLDRPVARPTGVSAETAAALVTVGEAAYRGLHHLGVKPRQTLLIHGAAGSVGTIAVQLAVARGIIVIGTAAPADLDRVTALGATAVEYGEGWADRVRAAAREGTEEAGGAERAERAEDIEEVRGVIGVGGVEAVDAVFDTSGAGVLAESVALAGDPARVITIADEAAAEYGVRFTGADPADRYPEALPELAALAASGRLSVPIWRTYPLAEAARAHEDLEAGRNNGKIVLCP